MKRCRCFAASMPKSSKVVENSPVKLLATIEQERLGSSCMTMASSPISTASSMPSIITAAPTWFLETYSKKEESPELLANKYRLAHFSAEFGIHESIPIYSGGWACYRAIISRRPPTGHSARRCWPHVSRGYFRQYLTVDGWQQERYPENDFFSGLP